MPKYCCILMILLLTVSCEKQSPNKQGQTKQPPKVTVALPTHQDVKRFEDFTGHLEATEKVEIRARVMGYLQEIHFKDSSDVKVGQLLFTIDPTEFQIAVDQAKAILDARKADLLNAETDLERVEKASKTGAVSQREVTQKTANRDNASAMVAAADAALQNAKTQLSYTKIKSPIDGRISRKLVTKGNLVGNNENTLLTTVVKMDPMYAYFDVSENLLLRALRNRNIEKRRNPDSPIALSLSGDEGFPHKGTTDYIDNTSSSTTGTISMRGVFSNKEELLFPGAFARIRIYGDVVENAMLINERAIGTDLGGKYVLIVDQKNVVQIKYIKLGKLYDGMREVESGLKVEDRYIIKGLQRARPGLPVTIELDNSPATNATTKDKTNDNTNDIANSKTSTNSNSK